MLEQYNLISVNLTEDNHHAILKGFHYNVERAAKRVEAIVEYNERLVREKPDERLVFEVP